MSKPVRKWRAALNMDEQKNLATANPKSISKSDKYGTSQWVDVVEWEDGNISISGYDPESKKSFKIGAGKQQDMNQQGVQTPQQASAVAQSTVDDGLPF